ncbi:HNH endonuclease [Pontibacter sp. SGAir0037]|uniref:HNH endonuclease n=1 Tax=Pontibacter sp. SGAir0037 TaxID=2571030 RepID=UPI0010CD3BD7|nr:hypothetical protein C1N53_08345 [Pontibacter sp. SGAir0037]
MSNGLALCPNLHRAFDRGLVSIFLLGWLCKLSSLTKLWTADWLCAALAMCLQNALGFI